MALFQNNDDSTVDFHRSLLVYRDSSYRSTVAALHIPIQVQYLSLHMRKPTMLVSDQVRQKQGLQSQKHARTFKFWT